MALKITDLTPGDRVILNCPKARVSTHREAQFEGIYRSVEEAMDKLHTLDAMLMPGATAEFLASGHLGWAAFLLQTSGNVELRGAFVVEPDGCLREEEGRRIFIERRLGRVGVG